MPIPGRPPVLVMETGVNQVSAGNGPGWVSGDVANLATSSQVFCIFDLGPDWASYVAVQLTLCPAGGNPATFSGFTGVQVTGNDTPAYNSQRRLGGRGVSTGATTIYLAGPLAPANGAVTITVVPCGRYVIAAVLNGDAANTAGAASKLTLVALPF